MTRIQNLISPRRKIGASASHQFNSANFDFDEYAQEYSSSQIPVSNTATSTPNTGAMAFISAGLLVLTIWSVSLIAERLPQVHAQESLRENPAALVSALPAAQPEEDTTPLPANDVLVVTKGMGIYHWQRDCPLAYARSRRGETHRGPKTSRTTRRSAELRGLFPCRYCSEIEYWRAKAEKSESQ